MAVQANPTSPLILQTYTLLQIAAEAFLGQTLPADPAAPPGTGAIKPTLTVAMLTEGNKHSSRMTLAQATQFATEWEVVSHQPNTATGFSGTLFKYTGATDAARGVTNGMLVVSLRSTEFIEDTARDNQATNTLEVKEGGWAFGQISDMQKWYETKVVPEINADTKLDITGYSLGGHLATAFHELYSNSSGVRSRLSPWEHVLGESRDLTPRLQT